jgi:dihydroorotase-like cyclic amidohydrolase
MAAAGAIGFKIFFGETIGNLPFPDDGMCMEAFDYIAQSKLPLGIHAENRQIMAYCTNKLKPKARTRRATEASPGRTSAKPNRCTTRSSLPKRSAPSYMSSI